MHARMGNRIVYESIALPAEGGEVVAVPRAAGTGNLARAVTVAPKHVTRRRGDQRMWGGMPSMEVVSSAADQVMSTKAPIFWALRRSSYPVNLTVRRIAVAQHGGKRGSQLMAHVGDELRLVLARDLELAALLG